MPDDKLPIPQFAARIKQKYPEYKDVNDTLLVQRIVDKYPEYKEQVDLSGINQPQEPIKKKEETTPSGIGSLISGVGSSLSKSSDEPSQTPIDTNDPVKSYLSPYGNDINRAVQQSRMVATESTGQHFLSPIAQKEQDINSQQNPSFDRASKNLLHASNVVKQTLFPSGKDAKEYLTKRILANGKLDENNETEKMAVQSKNEYDNLFNTIHSNGNIIDAAINDKISNDSYVQGLHQALTKEGLNFDRATRGQYVADYIYKNLNNLQDLSKEHPEIKNDLEYVQKNFYDMFPEQGQAMIANRISQAREKLGYNNTYANFNTATFKKHNDEIAATLSPEEQKLYNEHKDEIRKMIDTGGALNRFEESIEGGLSETKGLFNRITGLNSKTERISEEMKKEAMSVNNGEKGWKKTLGTASNFAGTIAYMMAGGRVAEGTGMSTTAADATMNGLTFGEGMMRNGEMKYPNNPFKATLNGVVNTVAFAALSPLKAGKLNEVFGKITPEIDAAIKDLPEKASSNEAKKTVMDAISNGLKNYGVSVTEMGVILPSISQGMDMAMGLDKKTFDKYHEGEFERSIKDMAIGALLPSALRTVVEARQTMGNEPQAPSPEQQDLKDIIEQTKPAELIEQPQPREKAETKSTSVILPEENKVADVVPLKKADETTQTEIQQPAENTQPQTEGANQEIRPAESPEVESLKQQREALVQERDNPPPKLVDEHNQFGEKTGNKIEQPLEGKAKETFVANKEKEIAAVDKQIETVKNKEYDTKSKDIEDRRQKELDEVSKSGINLNFISNEELLKSPNPRELRNEQKGIRKQLAILKDLINCK